MVHGVAGHEVECASGGALPRIPGAENEPRDARVRNGRGAHRAGLERHVERCAAEPVVGNRRRRGAQRQDLRMRRRIVGSPIGRFQPSPRIVSSRTTRAPTGTSPSASARAASASARRIHDSSLLTRALPRHEPPRSGQAYAVARRHGSRSAPGSRVRFGNPRPAARSASALHGAWTPSSGTGQVPAARCGCIPGRIEATRLGRGIEDAKLGLGRRNPSRRPTASRHCSRRGRSRAVARRTIARLAASRCRGPWRGKRP